MTSFLRLVLEEADALGLPGWQRAFVILALAVLSASGKVGLRAVVAAAGKVKIEPPEPPMTGPDFDQQQGQGDGTPTTFGDGG